MKGLVCWNCGYDISNEPLPLSRHANCDGCGEMLHCCFFCTAYDPDRPEGCDNDNAEPPSNKTIANFCEYFTLNDKAFGHSGAANDQAKAQLDSLFGDTEDVPQKGNGNPLDNLFND